MIGEANFTQILEEAEGSIVPETDPVYLQVIFDIWQLSADP